MRCIFDGNDIGYLATHLSTPQLRAELAPPRLLTTLPGRNGHDIIIVQRQAWRGEPWAEDYVEAVRLATQIKQALEPQPQLKQEHQRIDVAAVKSRADLVVIAGQYTKLTKSGRTFRGICPFHSERSASFCVYPDKNTWHCFGSCNTGGDAISFVMLVENCDFKTAISKLWCK